MPVPRKAAVCFGRVAYVRRSWITVVIKGKCHGHWRYCATVVTLGKKRHCLISHKFFDELIASGVTRRQDHCHHPDSIVKPPTKTVRTK